MISTADDVHRFFAALLGGELLTPAMLAEMLTTVPVAPGWGYGLGIESLEYTCGTVWGHSGSVQGYFTLAYNDVSGDRTALVMMSTRPDLTLLALQQGALDTAICQMLHRTPPAPDDAGSIPVRRVVPDPFA
jgi:D-alanyl-D-alanine carboxypeptidase